MSDRYRKREGVALPFIAICCELLCFSAAKATDLSAPYHFLLPA